MKHLTTGVTGFALLLATGTACSGSPATQSPRTADATPTESARVDLEPPTFSDPTTLTNPYFAIEDVDQMVQLGAEGPDQLRFEVTLLPRTKTVEWNGESVEARVHQFVAYSNGRILEVAEDFYAQDDDGNVWYLGENVDNYRAGVIADHEGEWLAGRDGTAGMIMPADPQVGDVYRPENIPGLVFEEVTVKAVGQTVDGPRGPVEGAVLIQEELMDGTLEDKIFAPGYGEFQAEVVTEDELYGAAVAVPTDALPGPLPEELATLEAGAERLVDAPGRLDDSSLAQSLDELTRAWKAYQRTEVPTRLAAQMADAFDALRGAADAGATDQVRQAALDVRRATLDISLRYDAPVEVDVARMDVWAQQVRLDGGARTQHHVVGDAAVLETIWKRLVHTADPATATAVSRTLKDLRTAADAGNLPTATEAASRLRQQLSTLG